jgi:hypothetical protein
MRVVPGSAVAAVALCLAVPPSATAQGTWRQVVTSQIDAAAAALRERGYRPVSPLLNGSLSHQTIQAASISLTAGTHYYIVGACDQDCTDFDLRLYAPDGALVIEDVELDDTPLLEFQAPVTGQYRLLAMMARCNANPCYWGAMVFAR